AASNWPDHAEIRAEIISRFFRRVFADKKGGGLTPPFETAIFRTLTSRCRLGVKQRLKRRILKALRFGDCLIRQLSGVGVNAFSKAGVSLDRLLESVVRECQRVGKRCVRQRER